MADLVFIPNTAQKSFSISLDMIPEEIRQEVEDVYEALKAQPGRMQAKFKSAGEANAYIAQVQAYCAQRPAGPLRFRKSPTKGLPEGSFEFRITDPQTKEEKTTEEIRDAVVKVNESK